jgi:hypothetical protein
MPRWRPTNPICATPSPIKRSAAGKRNTTALTGPARLRRCRTDRPATVADLHALLMDQLDDLRKRIARENTDIYKSFWNLDSYSRPKTPRPEAACRDAGDAASAGSCSQGYYGRTGRPHGSRQARRHLGRDADAEDPVRVEARLPRRSLDRRRPTA